MDSIKKLDREDKYISAIAVVLFGCSLVAFLCIVREVVMLSYCLPEAMATIKPLLSNHLFVAVGLLVFIAVAFLLNNCIGNLCGWYRGEH